MGGDLSKRNQSLYCHYHQEKGHITKDCRTLCDHLGQLVKVGKLRQFLHQLVGQFGQPKIGYQRDAAPWLALGIINVIFYKPKSDVGTCLGVMFVVAMLTLGFSEEDKEGMLQPHDDALVVTIRIRRYDVRKVLVDEGSEVQIMYLDLYKGLNLRPEDLVKYDSPLVGFDGRLVIPCGMIRLTVQVGDEEVQVDFIVVEAYSPYITILASPWLHAVRVVSSTLHLKVKYPIHGRVGGLVGS